MDRMNIDNRGELLDWLTLYNLGNSTGGIRLLKSQRTCYPTRQLQPRDSWKAIYLRSALEGQTWKTKE